jgi:hypothetical protein
LLLNIFYRSYGEMLGRFDLGQVVPPGFAWVERAMLDLFGPAEWAMRLPALVAGLMALAVLGALGRRVLSPQFAWMPLAFAALSRHALTHAVEVKPYSFDLTFAAVVLLAIAGLGSRWASGLLLAVAAAGPWMSFPGVFVLGGAGAALVVRARGRGWWLIAAFAGLTAASAAGLWFAHARYQDSPLLQEFWGPKGMGGFPDLADPVAAAVWPVEAAVNIGNYGSRDVGAVLLALGAVGLIANARRYLLLVVAVAVPVGLAGIAAYLGKYPLAERTGMFLLPGLWLAAALGVEAVVSRFATQATVVMLLPFAVMAPDAVLSVGKLIVPPEFPECRDAFERVRTDRRPGDMLWISSPEVYRVYHGPTDRLYGHMQFPDEWEAAARCSAKVWVVNQLPPENPVSIELASRLSHAGQVKAEVIPFWGVRVERWQRPPPPRLE